MSQQSEQEMMVEEAWRTFLINGETEEERRQRRFFRFLPAHRRCKLCYAPFDGLAAPVARIVFDKRPSHLNPQICTVCEDFATQYQGGAEIELSMLFADVRGSTALAEGMGASAFSKLINRFYSAVSDVLIRTDALIDKLIGDEVIGLYVPGLAGPQHARRAVEAAQEILRVTGHNRVGKPWIPLGVGVHTGTAYVGSVGHRGGATDITVLGDAANTAARLCAKAKTGEILISEASGMAAGLDLNHLERRLLELKGKSQCVAVYALSAQCRDRRVTQ